MNEEELLTQELQRAHAAGDTDRATRVARALRNLRQRAAPQQSTPQPQGGMGALSGNMAAALAGPASPQQPGQAPTLSPSMAGALAGSHPPTSPSPRERGHASAAETSSLPGGVNPAAAIQGLGSGFFGIGTPITAAGQFLSAALPGGEPAMSPGDALEYARGRREGLREQDPRSYYAGLGASLVGAPAAVRGLGSAAAAVAPRAASRAASVFTPQAGQTARNIARIAATGAAASGVTAGLEEGAGAVPLAAGVGAVAGPVLHGAIAGGRAVGGAVTGWTSPNRAAIRTLARRLGEPVDDVARRYNEFRTLYGRPPRLAEIMSQRTGAAGELSLVGRVHSGAGEVLRDAAEDVALSRPRELPPVLRGGRPTQSVPAIEGRMGETVQRARGVLGRRSLTSDAMARGVRDVEMDELMQQIGNHVVYMDDNMAEFVKSPEVWGSLSSSLRRRLADAIDAAEDVGSRGITVREWDMIRQDVARRAGPGSGQIAREVRDRLRDYVGRAVPEYEQGLTRFAELSEFARGTQLGGNVVSRQTTRFVDRLRTAGGGTPATPRQPAARDAVQHGARIGARTRLAEMLSGTPEETRTFMRRLATDPRLQRNVRAALEPGEARELLQLGDRYGVQLRFLDGFELGRTVRRPASGNEAFREAVARAGTSGPERIGIEQGARTALSEAAGEGMASAVSTLSDVATNPQLQDRLQAALGAQEAGRVRRIGEMGYDAARNLIEMVPEGTRATARSAEYARELQNLIAAGVVATGTGSGAFKANVGNWLVQRMRLSPAAARRMAELATDPQRAHAVIEQMRRAVGMTPQQIVEMYRDAAIRAGILTGQR